MFKKHLLGLLLLTLVGVYYCFNPANYVFFPDCTFRKLTGLSCTGCGGQRAFHALLHGRFQEAYQFNALIYLLIPAAGLTFFNEIFEANYCQSWLKNRPFSWFLLLVVLVFSVWRNL